MISSGTSKLRNQTNNLVPSIALKLNSPQYIFYLIFYEVFINKKILPIGSLASLKFTTIVSTLAVLHHYNLKNNEQEIKLSDDARIDKIQKIQYNSIYGHAWRRMSISAKRTHQISDKPNRYKK